MGFGIAAVLVLADPQIERVAGHERLDAAPARRAAVVERQIAVDDVGHEIGAPHGEPAHRVRLDVVLVLVEIVGATEAVAEHVRAIEDRADVVDEIHQVRRRGAAEQQRRARACVDDPVPCIHRNREQRSLLPLKHVALGVGVKPDFRGAAPFDHEIDFLIEVLLGVECARARHLDHRGRKASSAGRTCRSRRACRPWARASGNRERRAWGPLVCGCDVLK